MKIFLIGPINSSFVQNDIKILGKENQLFLENSAIGRGIRGIWNLLLLTLRSVFKTFRSEAIFCWFADYTTLIPSLIAKVFRKKIYVVAGGFDVTNLPEINCGARLRPFRWFCVKNTFRLADKIFPVSNYAKKQLLKLTNVNENKVKMIYNCIDISSFGKETTNSNREFVLTVSQGDHWIEYIRKGTQKFIEIAKELKDTKFVIAGLRGEALQLAKKDANNVSNIEIIPGPLNLYEEIVPLYRKSFAYCQFSIEETFGVAVLEAMICGSLPIVSEGGALPEIISGSEAIVAQTKEKIINAISKAKELSNSERKKLQEFAYRYDIREREIVLLNEIGNK
ncbi:MAG: glycosyltransferase [Ignavibacteria bacterium]|nr:glycosyltransferase [Ignavibacteria bacterium]